MLHPWYLDLGEMKRFVNSVFDLMKEECCTSMHHNDMKLSVLMVYAKSIKESKLTRISKNLKRSGSNEQNILGLRRGLQIKKNLVLVWQRVRVVVVLE